MTEKPERCPTTRERVYAWMRQPTHETCARIVELGLFEEGDDEVRGDEIHLLWMKRAKHKNLVDELLNDGYTAKPAAQPEPTVNPGFRWQTPVAPAPASAPQQECSVHGDYENCQKGFVLPDSTRETPAAPCSVTSAVPNKDARNAGETETEGETPSRTNTPRRTGLVSTAGPSEGPVSVAAQESQTAEQFYENGYEFHVNEVEFVRKKMYHFAEAYAASRLSAANKDYAHLAAKWVTKGAECARLKASLAAREKELERLREALKLIVASGKCSCSHADQYELECCEDCDLCIASAALSASPAIPEPEKG